MTLLNLCLPLGSGEPRTLRLHQAPHHAGEDPHAGPEGRDTGNALRKLPGAVHPEPDPHGGERAEPQVCRVDRDGGRSGTGRQGELSWGWLEREGGRGVAVGNAAWGGVPTPFPIVVLSTP